MISGAEAVHDFRPLWYVHRL